MSQGRNRKEIKKISNKQNINTTYQNLWDAAKAVLRGKFIVVNVHIKKLGRAQINNLTLHFKELETEE